MYFAVLSAADNSHTTPETTLVGVAYGWWSPISKRLVPIEQTGALFEARKCRSDLNLPEPVSKKKPPAPAHAQTLHLVGEDRLLVS